MASTNSKYAFLLLSTLGLGAQWGAMIMNGTLLGLMTTAWKGRFPSGAPMRTTWTGIWPVDYILGLLVAFFCPLLEPAGSSVLAPVLLLADLLFSLTVFDFMANVQGKRVRNAGPLRYPSLWQLAWRFFGAASTLPVYLHSSIRTGALNINVLPLQEAQALPFMALWAVATNLFLLAPGIVGASAFIIQLSVVVWFFLPLTTGFIGRCIAALPTRFRLFRIGNPVLSGYGVVGVTSAIVHVGIGLWIYCTPDMSWKAMYWPAYSAVQPGPNLLLRGGVLFCQYGHTSLWSSVITLAVYTFGQDGHDLKCSRGPISHRLGSLIGVMIVFGPGAGAAYLCYTLEKEMDRSHEVFKER